MNPSSPKLLLTLSLTFFVVGIVFLQLWHLNMFLDVWWVASGKVGLLPNNIRISDFVKAAQNRDWSNFGNTYFESSNILVELFAFYFPPSLALGLVAAHRVFPKSKIPLSAFSVYSWLLLPVAIASLIANVAMLVSFSGYPWGNDVFWDDGFAWQAPFWLYASTIFSHLALRHCEERLPKV